MINKKVNELIKEEMEYIKKYDPTPQAIAMYEFLNWMLKNNDEEFHSYWVRLVYNEHHNAEKFDNPDNTLSYSSINPNSLNISTFRAIGYIHEDQMEISKFGDDVDEIYFNDYKVDIKKYRDIWNYNIAGYVFDSKEYKKRFNKMWKEVENKLNRN